MKLENMRKIRLEKKLTQFEVAKRVGTAQGRVSNVELGLPVKYETGWKFARALGCDLEDLM
jgi:transcriptional regulator with XRE-family HTH domain